MRVVEIEGLSYRYPATDREALAGIDLVVEEGEFLALVGPNGSGKSTLARILGGLERPRSAHVALACGHDLLDDDGRWDARREVGVLFQDPENQLVGENVEEDLAFGLENLALPPADILARVERMIADFDLDELRHREPHLLSGGQKQRTALAGVLAIPRRVLVLDEPTAMLDPVGRCEVLAAVRREHGAGLTVIYVTQEMDEVLEADRVVALDGGRVAFDGTPRGLFGRHELVERLGLGLPPAGALALALAARGRVLAPTPLTLDELLRSLRDGEGA